MKLDLKPYVWDFDGSCAPQKSQYAGWKTFSLGIFQWVPKSRGKGLKRGKVIRRVKGYTDCPDEAFDRARQIVAGLNATEPKR